ncbi:MAG: helix-turn-helix domain-containing protein [Muribaculaceae bacterium]
MNEYYKIQNDHDDLRRIDVDFLQSAGKESFGNDLCIFDTVNRRQLQDSLFKLEMPLFALCTRGRATLHIDVDNYDVTPGCLVAFMPNITLHGITPSDDIHAIFLGVSLDFANELLPDIHALLPVLFGTRKNPVMELCDADTQCLCRFHAFLWHIIRTEQGPHKRQMVQNVLRAMLYKLMEIYSPIELESSKRSRNDDIFFDFIHLVERDYKISRTVQHYADLLCITPKHLSTVVKMVSKQTAGEWITDHVVVAAKVLLRSSEKSIQEIAMELNFPNQSFFGKYFKKHTGMSPQAYRKQLDN